MSVQRTPEDQLRLAEVDLGLAVEQFLRSAVGKYLVGRAKHELDDAVERLKLINPYQPRAIQEIQNEIWRADTFEKWLTDAILHGRNAEEQLTSSENNGD